MSSLEPEPLRSIREHERPGKPTERITPAHQPRLTGAWALAALLAVAAGPAAHAQSSDTAPDIEDDATGEHAPDGEGAGDREEPEQAAEAPAVDDRPWAEGVPFEAQVQARDLFMEGNVLLRDTLFAGAAAKFEEAIALWAHPAFLYNLALARIHLDQPIAAYENMREALRHGPRPIGQDRYDHAQGYLKLLQSQLAEIEVVCDQPGATVAFDGKPLFDGPGRRTLMALPGSHILMATAPGRLPDTQQIVLEPGQQAKFSLAPPYPDRVVMVRRWPAWRPWAVVTAGALVLAGGGALDWRALSTFDRAEQRVAERCAGDAGCERDDVPASVFRQRDRARALRTGARVTYAVSGAVLVTGAVLLYLNRERSVTRRGPEPSPQVSVFPLLAPEIAGVSAHWQF